MLRGSFAAVFAGADDEKGGAPLTEEQKQERALAPSEELLMGHVPKWPKWPWAAATSATGAIGGAPWGHDPRE
eukprot:4114262-Pyramimonas_sp.AAC.1